MFELSPNAKVSHVKLNVFSIEKSVLFYEELLGFKTVRKTDEYAVLSANGISLIHLSRVDKKHKTIEEDQLAIPRAGLFHFAILLPSRNDLANVFKHLSDNSDRFRFDGAADHLVSESLYLRDPDYNGVEIYRDRDQSDWERTGPFQIKMSTEPLDLDKLYSEADDSEKWNMPKKTVIGHVHLHVSNLQESKEFYTKTLGLHHTCIYPGANFFAANSYHHHIATNTWLGKNIKKADQGEIGLDYFTLKINSAENYDRLLNHLENAGLKYEHRVDESEQKQSIFIYDPDRIKIQIFR